METSLLFVIIVIQVVSTAYVITLMEQTGRMLVPICAYQAFRAKEGRAAHLSASQQTPKEEPSSGPRNP